MANHPSALKRAKQSELRKARNKTYKTRVKTIVREVQEAIATNNPEKAKKTFIETVSIIQKTADKGVIHKKKASRKISRLARHLNKMAS